jgi:hypothetical protein
MKRDNSIKGKERVGRRIISTHTNKSRKIVPNWTVSCEILRGVCVLLHLKTGGQPLKVFIERSGPVGTI